MKATKKPDSEKTVDESVSHYKVEKLADGRVKLSSGGHVTIAQTYYEALESFAKHEQKRIEESPDHLRKDHLKSIYHDTVNPELSEVIAPATEDLKEEAIDAVRGEPEGAIATRGAWLARVDETDTESLDERVNVYRLWDTKYSWSDLPAGVDEE